MPNCANNVTANEIMLFHPKESLIIELRFLTRPIKRERREKNTKITSPLGNLARNN